METNVGCRIYKEVKRPERELVEKFRGIPSSNIGDTMNRLSCMRSEIKAYTKGVTMLGTALTVKTPEGDNLLMHMAIQMAKPGDIIVVDAGGCMSRSLCGEMMVNQAMGKGIAGFVVDGCVRDVDCLEKTQFPVYAKGVTPQGPWKNGPGEINVPISCGGQVVFPGDILVGDGDGIVVIHPADAELIYEQAREKFSGEQQRLEEYHNGIYKDETEKYGKILEEKGFVFL